MNYADGSPTPPNFVPSEAADGAKAHAARQAATNAAKGKEGVFRRIGVKGLLIAGGVLGAGAVAGVGAVAFANSQATLVDRPGTDPGTDVVNEDPEVESPAVQRYPSSDFEQSDPLPSNLEYVDNVGTNEFMQAPVDDQIKWATWFAQYKPEFVTYFASVSGLSGDAPYTINANSGPLELLEDNAYDIRIAESSGNDQSTTKETNGSLDTVRATNYLIALSNHSPETVQEIKEFVAVLGDSDGQARNVATQALHGMHNLRTGAESASDFIALPATIEIDGKTINAHAISFSFTESDGDQVTIRTKLGAYETTDYKGRSVYVTISE